jgi:hypothetical protein
MMEDSMEGTMEVVMEDLTEVMMEALENFDLTNMPRLFWTMLRDLPPLFFKFFMLGGI